MVFAPDQQVALRTFHATTATGAVAANFGFAAYTIFRTKYRDDAPPILLMWVRERQLTQKSNRNVHNVEVRDDGDTGDPYRNSIFRVPLFAMTTVLAPDSKEGGVDDSEASPAPRGRRKKRGAVVTIASSGLRAFASDVLGRSLDYIKHWREHVPNLTSWQNVWGPISIGTLTILLWLYPAELYHAQLNNGPVQRPRLTMIFAMAEHQHIMEGIIITVVCYSLFLCICVVHATSELCMAIKAYAAFYAITAAFALLLILATLNSSFYPIGTPLLETLVTRATLNAYAWVVVIMVKPLDSTNGKFSKRQGKVPSGSFRSGGDDDSTDDEEYSEDEDSDSSSDDEEEKREKTTKTVQIGGAKIMMIEDIEDDRSEEDEEEEEEDDDDDDDDEEDDSNEDEEEVEEEEGIDDER